MRDQSPPVAPPIVSSVTPVSPVAPVVPGRAVVSVTESSALEPSAPKSAAPKTIDDPRRVPTGAGAPTLSPRPSPGSDHHASSTRGYAQEVDGVLYWIFVRAGFQVRGGTTQVSFADAWITGADGRTPSSVGRLVVSLQVGGFPPVPATETADADHATNTARTAYDGRAATVRAVAYSENPKLGPVFDDSLN